MVIGNELGLRTTRPAILVAQIRDIIFDFRGENEGYIEHSNSARNVYASFLWVTFEKDSYLFMFRMN